jgi:hypothetical protein
MRKCRSEAMDRLGVDGMMITSVAFAVCSLNEPQRVSEVNELPAQTD